MKRSHPMKEGRHLPFPRLAACIATAAVFLAVQATSAQMPAAGSENGSNRSTEITLDIDQTIEMSLLKNRDIATAELNAESQRFSIDAAQAAFDLQIIPSGSASLTGGSTYDYGHVAAGLQFQKQLTNGTIVSVGPRVSRSEWPETQRYTADVGVTVTQPLLRGRGKDIATDGVQTAQASYETSLRNAYQTKVNTALESISTYYEAIRQMERVALHQQMEARLESHTEIARAKEKIGLSSPMDTYRAEIPLKKAQDAIIKASKAAQSTKDNLKLLLALPQNVTLTLIVPETPAATKLPLEAAVDIALQNRMEIEQMHQDILEAKREAEVMKHNILPELNLVLNYDRYSTTDTLDAVSPLDLDRYTIKLEVGSDIFRKAEKAAYQQSLLRVRILDTDMESVKDDISRQVRNQWMSLKEILERIEIMKAQIKQGEEKLALAEVKFTHGMADNFDIIEAEEDLQNARSDLLDAEIEYAIGGYSFKAILGTLVPRN